MMHFEILVEDKSGKAMLDVLVPKILQPFEGNVSWIIHAYRGIGKIPRNLNAKAPKNRMLLNQLPRLLRGYGNTYPKNSSYPCTIIVVCDLDDRCLKEFRQELLQILDSCNPQPIVNFCIAVEEGEAWLLGDISAIKSAYPNAKDSILNFNQSDNLKWENWQTPLSRRFQ